MPRRVNKRAPNGTAEVSLLLRMPAALQGLAELAAQRAGLTVSEWWRQAARDALLAHGTETAPGPADCLARIRGEVLEEAHVAVLDAIMPLVSDLRSQRQRIDDAFRALMSE